eukprot:m.117435 g.117435  ORF g.117435 m.117435 type:complete len:68 (+) comp15427_c3_seq5:679-882(+)
MFFFVFPLLTRCRAGIFLCGMATMAAAKVSLDHEKAKFFKEQREAKRLAAAEAAAVAEQQKQQQKQQ